MQISVPQFCLHKEITLGDFILYAKIRPPVIRSIPFATNVNFLGIQMTVSKKEIEKELEEFTIADA